MSGTRAAAVRHSARVGSPVTSGRSALATVLLWSGVPLWLLVALDGPGPFAFAFLLAVLVSAPAVVLTVALSVRGGLRWLRGRPGRTATAVRVAVAAHLLAVASFPVGVAVGSALEDRRAHDFLAGLEADARRCAASVLADWPREGERAPAELHQDPGRLALARTQALAEPAAACLRSARDDVDDCSPTVPVCSVATPARLRHRGSATVSLVPALRAEHARQEQRSRPGRGRPPAPLDFAGAREGGPAATFG